MSRWIGSLFALSVFLALPAFGQGLGPQAWHPGNEQGIVGNWSATGTCTCDAFDSPADTDHGQSIALRECEGGTGCDAAGAGETVTFDAFPSNDAGIVNDRTVPLGHQTDFFFREVNMTDADEGNGLHCVPRAFRSSVVLEDDCEGTPYANGYWTYTQPFDGGAFVRTCSVRAQTFSGMASGDIIEFVMQSVSAADEAISAFTTKFYVKFDAECSTDPNCLDAVNEEVTWTINEDVVEIDPDITDGYLQISVNDTTNYGGTEDLSLFFLCTYW